MRLATLEFKLVLTSLLRHHRFVVCDRTERPLKVQGVTTLSPGSVFVRLESR